MNGRYERNPGRIVELSPGGSQDLLDIQWKDEIAHVICVTLVGPPAETAGDANAAVVVAHVQWGAGEAEAEAEIDFGVGGVVFTLPASSIRITADYEATFASGERDPVVRVGAFASVGSGARQTQLTRTRFEPDAPVSSTARTPSRASTGARWKMTLCETDARRPAPRYHCSSISTATRPRRRRSCESCTPRSINYSTRAWRPRSSGRAQCPPSRSTTSS